MLKRAYSVQMSYEVTDDEKRQAEKAILFFKHAVKLLKLSSDHLNTMKTPFKENPEIDPAEIMKTRASIRRFRDKAVENFNDFKAAAFKCVKSMQQFSSDTQTIKLIKSYISAIDDLQAKVNKFVDLFQDLENKDFVTEVVKLMEDIQKQCEDVEKIVNERISPHIQDNILNTSWIDDVGNDLQIKLTKETPIILDLFNERQEKLNNILTERTPSA